MSAAAPAPRLVVLGLGNLLLGDDGVGVHAIERLRRGAPTGVEFVDVGTAVLHALDWIDGADAVLAIDALRAGGAPGTVYVADDWGPGEREGFGDAHALGLRSALAMLPAGRRPARRALVGVEPARVACGLDLSPPVRAALPAVVAAVRRVVEDWSRELAAAAARRGRQP